MRAQIESRRRSRAGRPYFPTLLTGVLAIASLAAIFSLGLLGVGRVAGSSRSGRSIVRPPSL